MILRRVENPRAVGLVYFLLLFCVSVRCFGAELLGFSERGLSDQEIQNLEKAKAALFETQVGRRLLAEADGVPEKVNRLKESPAIVYRYEPKFQIVFGEKILDRPVSWDLDLALARGLSEAALGLPVKVADAGFISRLDRAAFALEYASKHPNFSKSLLASAKAFQFKEGLSGVDIKQSLKQVEPRNELDDTAEDLVLIKRDPYFLFLQKRRSPLVEPKSRPMLFEIENFIRLYGPDFKGESLRADGLFGVTREGVDRGDIFSDARKIVEWGGLKRLKEALGKRDAQSIDKLQRQAARWLEF